MHSEISPYEALRVGTSQKIVIINIIYFTIIRFVYPFCSSKFLGVSSFSRFRLIELLFLSEVFQWYRPPLLFAFAPTFETLFLARLDRRSLEGERNTLLDGELSPPMR